MVGAARAAGVDLVGGGRQREAGERGGSQRQSGGLGADLREYGMGGVSCTGRGATAAKVAAL